MNRARRGPVATALAVGVLALTSCGLISAGTTSSPESSSGEATSSAATDDGGLGLTRFAPGERPDAPSLAGTTLTGSAFDVAQHRGKVVVLNSWASWCDPCREELPVLVPLSKAVNPADITFVGLDVNDTASAAAARVKEFGIPYPSIVDDGAKKLSMIPGVPPGAIPSTVVIDRHGRIAARVIGAVKPGVLDPVLADLAAEK